MYLLSLIRGVTQDHFSLFTFLPEISFPFSPPHLIDSYHRLLRFFHFLAQILFQSLFPFFACFNQSMGEKEKEDWIAKK
jgi:hypothetical protein